MAETLRLLQALVPACAGWRWCPTARLLGHGDRPRARAHGELPQLEPGLGGPGGDRFADYQQRGAGCERRVDAMLHLGI
jgi:hypothetical protein